VSARQEPGITLNLEVAAWVAVLVAAALVRLVDLSALPLRPDESLRARAAFDFARGNVTADWMGDLTSALTALAFRALGDGDTTARLAPAILGVLGVAALALYRPLVGRAAALVGALLVTFSPVAVVAARSQGPEAAALPLALLLPPLAGAIWLKGQTARLPLLGLVVGAGLGTGALVPAMAIVVIAWLAIELAWLDGRATLTPLRPPRLSPGMLALGVLALAPGLALAAVRYGAGPDRLSLSAMRAWNGPPLLARPPETWHYALDVLIAYEPLVAVLGLIGLVLVIRRWRIATASGGRLPAVWATVGAVVVGFWLHRDPAQLQLLTVPLALLAGSATVRLSAGLTASHLRRLGLPLLALVPAVGLFLVMASHWAYENWITGGEVVAVLLVVLGGIAATAAVARLIRAPTAALALIAAWLLLGGAMLHATANAAYGGRTEILTGQRTRVESAAIVRGLEAAAQPGATVWVERRLWPALAWPLRERAVARFVETPPDAPAAIVVTGNPRIDPGDAGMGVPVAERWAPGRWDLLGILRWWVYRTPWGTTDLLRGAVTVPR
jgi:hypothetical protein